MSFAPASRPGSFFQREVARGAWSSAGHLGFRGPLDGGSEACRFDQRMFKIPRPSVVLRVVVDER